MFHLETTTPGDVPMSALEVRRHLRVDDDDIYLDEIIQSAADWIETYTNRRFLTQVVTQHEDCFTQEMLLRVYPVQSVAVLYDDEDGVEQTLPVTDYKAHLKRVPAVVKPGDDGWPTTSDEYGSVRIEITCGNVDKGALPSSFVHALRMMCGHMYRHREPGVVGPNYNELPLGLKTHLANHRLRYI